MHTITTVTGLGAMNRIRLIGDWKRHIEPECLIKPFTFCEYRLTSNPDCTFHFYERGSVVSDKAAKSYLALVNSNDAKNESGRQLMPRELKNIGEILRDKANANDFTIMNARVKELSGSRILEVCGYYRQSRDYLHVLLVLVPTAGGYRAEEFCFQTPDPLISTKPILIGTINRSFSTVCWRDN